MRIALVSPYDYPYPGGVTAHISQLEREFTRLGHVVKVIAPSSSDQAELARDNIYKIGSVIPVPANGSMARITLSLRMSGRVKRILQEEKFDIIHLHEPLVPGLPLTVLYHSKSVNIGTFHAYWGVNLKYFYSNPMLRFYSNPVLRNFYNRLDGRVAVSPAARSFVSKHFKGDYRIIPNGIDIERFRPDLEPLEELNDGKLNILFVGRLERRKGFQYLLRAFQGVKKQVPEARLVVAGAYSEKSAERYRKFVAKRGMQDIVFMGYLPLDKLNRCYRSADVFCAPSIGGESFGIVLLEAMAAGKPIVASAIEGYRAVVTQGSDGLLVPAKDDQALAKALVDLLRDPARRASMGANGREKAQDYSWTKVAQRLLDYYEEVRSDPDVQRRLRHRKARRFRATKRWMARRLGPKRIARSLVPRKKWARKIVPPKRWVGKLAAPTRWARRLVGY